MTQVDLRIFSPRWGHHDTYHVELHRDYLNGQVSHYNEL